MMSGLDLPHCPHPQPLGSRGTGSIGGSRGSSEPPAAAHKRAYIKIARGEIVKAPVGAHKGMGVGPLHRNIKQLGSLMAWGGSSRYVGG